MKMILQILKEITMNVVVAIISVFMIIVLINLFAEIARADTNVQVYKTLIAHEAAIQGLEPAIALAVAEIESDFIPTKTGKQGEVGLFQLHPRWHKNPPYDPNKNIKKGIQTLLYWQKACHMKEGKTWVQCYNTGNRILRFPQRAPYFQKFIKRYRTYSNQSSLAVAE